MKLLKVNAGTTLVETVVATVIISSAIIGLVQAFSYGRFHVEKMGLHRQALGHLQGEMDYLRARHLENPGVSLAGKGRKRTVSLLESKKVPATVESRVFPPRTEGGTLVSQSVDVKVYYRHAIFSDTLDLPAKFYLQ